METVIHKIRLLDAGKAAAFEDWVLNTDYATCPRLPSVRAFSVSRVSTDPGAPYHYVEVIQISSHAAFEADMRTPAFAGLVERFTTMAEVVEEIAGTRLGDGYRAE
jgi:hypothetical protein